MIIFLSIFLVLSAIILISSFFSPISRKIGFRNITRRIDNTILVVVGSMVGAALISGSLVLSDSLDKTFIKLVEEQLNEVDLIINVKEEKQFETPIAYFDKSEIDQIESNLKTDKVDATMPVNFLTITPAKLDPDGEPVINAYNVSLYGFDIDEYNNFGTSLKPLDQFESPNSAFITTYMANKLELKQGDTIAIPFGVDPVIFKVQKIYERGYIPSDPVVVVDRAYFNQQIGLPTDAANSVFVSAQGGIEPTNYNGKEFQAFVEDQSKSFDSENVSLSFYEAKQQALDGFGMKTFADFFLVMSFFGIFAGILLIINLYMMLAAERKYEMGILRAVALTRTQLMKTFVYEGYLYSVLSSVLGAVVGLGIGYIMVYSLNKMFGQLFALMDQENIFNIVFDVKLSSIIIAFCFGAIVTIITTFFASWKISRLNIVSAIRNTEEKKQDKHGIRWILTTLILIVMTVMSLMSLGLFFTVKQSLTTAREQGDVKQLADLTDEKFTETIAVAQSYLLYVGVVFSLIFGTFLLNRLIKLITKKDISRLTITLSSSTIVIFTAFLSKFDAFIEAGESQSSIAIFFISGIAIVIAMSLIVTYNLTIITRIVTWIFLPFKQLIPVFKIALRYPSVNRGRTGLTLIMFAIVIFLIVYTSMMKVTVKQVNENTLKESLGGYDELVIPSPTVTQAKLVQIETDIQNVDGVDRLTNITHTNIIMPAYRYKDLDDAQIYDNPYLYVHNDDDFFVTKLDGLPSAFIENKNIPLTERAEGYDSDKAVWDAVIADSSKVVIGVAFTELGYGQRPDLKVGQILKIADIFGQTEQEIQIIGIAKAEGAGFGVNANFYPNVITTREAIDELLPADYIDKYSSSELLVGFANNVNATEKDKEIKKALINYDIMQVYELNQLTRTAQGFMDSLILLFQAFLGFSLVVGASGLAIIVARSVQERRQQIGMLRSLGFQRSMILTSFFIEATFITFLGIVIGISMGTIGALNEFYVAFHDQPDIKPVFAYKEVFIISLIVYVASILFSIWPSIRAAKLSPVEATNYPE